MRLLPLALLVLLTACPPSLQKPTTDVSALALYVEPEPQLHEFVKPRVSREALRENRQQTPTLSVGPGAEAAGFVIAFGYAKK